MAVTLNETPSGNRLHIGIFGKTNSGKSSFINTFSGQKVSIVADVAGTTTDPVYKPMEIYPLGPCILIDTAGFDDEGELGALRIEKTSLAAQKTELAIILFCEDEMVQELKWYNYFKKRQTPVIPVLGKADLYTQEQKEYLIQMIQKNTGETVCPVSSETGEGIRKLKELLAEKIPEGYGNRMITGNLVSKDDLVLLVMPQDKRCLIMSVTTDRYPAALQTLSRPPKLIITDSQVFPYIYENKPKESMLTSFSVLFAAYKGDLSYYIEGAKAIDSLKETSHVLIAECCTHVPLKEDIGRVKIPRMLKKRFGENLQVELVSGTDFPDDLTGYDLIIQCGACMFNRKYVMYRIDRAKKQQVPVTNYGITIAHLTGILDHVALPE